MDAAQIRRMVASMDAHGQALVRLALRKQAEGETVAARYVLRKALERISEKR